MDLLKFSPARKNAKLNHLQKRLNKRIYTFSLVSGICCPGANECSSMVVETADGWRIKDGPNTQYRCFSASQEALFPAVREQRYHNRNVLLACGNSTTKMASLIEASLPKGLAIVRLHVAGDFMTQNYFDAWLAAAQANPTILFYGYTKSLPFWVRRIDKIPGNVKLTASWGGRYDNLIGEYGLRSARVVYSKAEAKALGLKIDKDDSLAAFGMGDFALLIHGPQPKGSTAWVTYRNMLGTGGVAGYSLPSRDKVCA
jgi:hypothetical protein